MPRGFKKLKRKLNRVKRSTPRKVHKSNVSSANSIVRSAQRRIVTQDAVASTELYRGFFTLVGDSEVHVGNDVPHAKYVEYGTGPQFGTSAYFVPPEVGPYKAAEFSTELIQALVQWARIKPSIAVFDPVAFAVHVAKQIDEHGTDPQPFWRPALRKGIPDAENAAQAEFSKDLKRTFSG